VSVVVASLLLRFLEEREGEREELFI